MIFIPFPIIFAEALIFIFSVQKWGFLNVLGFYILPCLLGFLILSFMGRWALLGMQKSLMQGEVPANSLLHSAAIFVSGVLFLVPSFFPRVLAIILLLPGSRHYAVAKLKIFFQNKMKSTFASGFSFGSGGRFSGGFKYYDFRQSRPSTWDTAESSERPVSEAHVLDVTPLKIVHEEKKNEDPLS